MNETNKEFASILGKNSFLIKGKLFSSHPNLLNRAWNNPRDLGLVEVGFELIKSILSFFKIKLRIKSPKRNEVQACIYFGVSNKSNFEFEWFSKKIENSLNVVLFTDDYRDGSRCIKNVVLSFRELFVYLHSGMTIAIGFLKVRSLIECLALAEALRQVKYKMHIEQLHITPNTVVLNLFSASSFGHQLNHIARLKGAKVTTYSWGSNIPSVEQLNTEQDFVALKGSFESGIYTMYVKEYLVGNISIPKIKRNSAKPSVLFLDTCENKGFTYLEKKEFYSMVLPLLVKKFRCLDLKIRPHPGSSGVVELIKSLNLDEECVSISNENQLEIDLASALVVVNINSSVAATVVANSIPLINLFPLFYNLYLHREYSKNDFYQFFDLPGIQVESKDDLTSNFFSIENLGSIVCDDYRIYASKYFPFFGADALEELYRVAFKGL